MCCLFFLCSIVYTWVLDHDHHGHTPDWWKYGILMTSWGICLFCGALLLDAMITVYSLLQETVLTTVMERKLPPGVMLFSWAWTTMAYTMAVFITGMYWSLLFAWDSPPSYANLFVHGLQVSVVEVKSHTTHFVQFREYLVSSTNSSRTGPGTCSSSGAASPSPSST